MATFNNRSTRPRVTSPVTTTGVTETFQGAQGFTRSVLSDLYLLSVSNLVGKDSFYEKGSDRTHRYVELLHEAAKAEPEHATRMMPWLRQDGYMRTGAVLGAAEVAKVLCDAHTYDGVEDMVDGSLQRADELGEFVAYWFSISGKAWPKRYQPVKRGLARATTRLITEHSVGKWDSPRREYRFYKVIEIAHPEPKDEAQSDLFRMLIAQGHRRTGVVTSNMPMLQALKQWRTAAANLGLGSSLDRFAVGALLNPANIKAAGLTWEDVLSELGSRVDKKILWEAMIPVMGPGALIRNLRNFDEAGISDQAADQVAKVLTDKERIRKARLFPYRFLSAYRAAPSLRWGHVLERGLAASLELVPTLKGKTLILVDRSPSMFPNYSGVDKDGISLADKAALFGAAMAIKAQDATLVEFGGDSNLGYWGSNTRGVGSRRISVPRGASVLKVVDNFGKEIPGTDIPRAVKDNFTAEYNRVVIVTDEQSRPGYLPSNMENHGGMRETGIDDLIPANVPVYLWNMEGYSASILETSKPNRHSFGGLSDASFGLIGLLENRKNAAWPWEC